MLGLWTHMQKEECRSEEEKQQQQLHLKWNKEETDDMAGGGNSASIAVRRGMQLFREGDVSNCLNSLCLWNSSSTRHSGVVAWEMILVRRPILGKGDCHCINWIGLKKVQSNFG
ncbi:hypothetical protein MRB53_031798 [Persea americana]|uniref:Uncharacterized protein n=1 Tax=Persea americana TaxID=3435 RepID=A0ACC2KQ02_PERAE|nr:hypothetical protein MRB53_031798 [Persea americana]